MEQAKEVVSLEVRVEGDMHHLSTVNSMLVLQGERGVGKGSSSTEKIRYRDVV